MVTKPSWIWQRPDWPSLRYDAHRASAALANAHRMHGIVEGKAASIGLQRASEVMLDTFSDEVMATSAIEGQRLPLDAVRSSVMRKLGLTSTGPMDRHVDGLVEVLNDASTAFDQPLTEDRLCSWQSALFPGGTSGFQRIAVGRYRDHEDPMQIISGALGLEVVHYEAPPSNIVAKEMQHFLAWFAGSAPEKPSPDNNSKPMDAIARAAIAHLWFESIHPFEDGNGRIGRAIIDMALAQHLKQPLRLYSLSRQLLGSRAAYYDALNRAQRGSCDLTEWVEWFAHQWAAACQYTSGVMDQAILKRRFWETHTNTALQERQRKVLQRLLDDGDGGFLGGLNAEKYIKMTGVSKATATRDLTQMVSDGQLRSHGAGKAIRYHINVPEWTHGLAGSISSRLSTGSGVWGGTPP